MPRKAQNPPRQCQYFVWRLFRRDGVYYADGRGILIDLGKHSLATRNKSQAIERLAQLDERKAIELGKLPLKTNPTIITRLTIDEGWKRYFNFAGRDPVMGGVSPGTIKRYRAVRDHHLKFCARSGIQTWSEFGKQQLEKFGNQRSSKQACRTVYLELTTLKTVSKWLVEEKLLPADQQLRYALSKPQGTDTYCYRPEEVAAMVGYCDQTPGLKWLGDLIVLLAHTGMRIGEATALRWTDIDLSAGVIRIADERSSRHKKQLGTIRTTKGKRSRLIPLHSRLKELLGGLPRYPDGRVLHAARGGKLLPRNVLSAFINHLVKPLSDKFPTPHGEIGFKDGRIHSFRHFFCSQSFLFGASEGEVREWLGHADSKMVEHYRHLRSSDAIRRMERITFLPEAEDKAV